MKTWSMREVYEGLDEKRQTVQGWAKDILDKPTGNSGIACSFTEDEVEALWRIKLFKKLGYKNAVIKEELLKSDKLKAESLQTQIDELIKQKEKLDQLINIAYMLKDTGLGPHAFRFGFAGTDEITFDELTRLLAHGTMEYTKDGYGVFSVVAEDKFWDEFAPFWEAIIEFHDQGHSFTDTVIQRQIESQFEIFPRLCSPSVLMFSGFSLLFHPQTELGIFIDNEYGNGFAKFYVAAVKFFCDEHSDNEFDRTPMLIVESIKEFRRQKLTAKSPEVQGQIKILHNYFNRLGLKSTRSQLAALRNLPRSFVSENHNRTQDGSPPKDFAWFLTKAIEIYCLGFDQVEETGNK